MALLGFVSTMLLTRVLSERVYAMYGLLTSFVTALATIISLGYDASYSRFFYLNGKPHKKYLFDCIKYPIIVFLLLLVGFFEPKHFLIRYVFGENFSPLLILFISIHVFLTLIQRLSSSSSGLHLRPSRRCSTWMSSNLCMISTIQEDSTFIRFHSTLTRLPGHQC